MDQAEADAETMTRLCARVAHLEDELSGVQAELVRANEALNHQLRIIHDELSRLGAALAPL